MYKLNNLLYMYSSCVVNFANGAIYPNVGKLRKSLNKGTHFPDEIVSIRLQLHFVIVIDELFQEECEELLLLAAPRRLPERFEFITNRLQKKSVSAYLRKIE